MSHAARKYGTVLNNIFGYESIANNTRAIGNNTANELYEHPGFMMLIEHKIKKDERFSTWMANPGLRGGGILETYLWNNPHTY